METVWVYYNKYNPCIKGKLGGTYNCVKYAEKQGKEIIKIDPRKIEA